MIQPSDLQGVNRLVIDAVTGVTDLVESVHCSILRIQEPPKASSLPVGGGIRLIYRSITQVTRATGVVLDKVLEAFVPLIEPGKSTFARETVIAALNGVLGDYLETSKSPLAITMGFRKNGRSLALKKHLLCAAYPQATTKVMVLAHGLCMNDLQWGRDPAGHRTEPGEDYCEIRYARLAEALGYTPIFLHYNSGRHISTNGHEFSSLLETLIQEWPVPIEDLVIVGHSMGGLITRSACHSGTQKQFQWPSLLKTIVFLGTPHHGSPLERGGNWIDRALGVNLYTAPFARLGKIRSSGITDLRYGYLSDEDWQGRDRFTHTQDRRQQVRLPSGVSCYTIAATTVKEPGNMAENFLGDGLVTINSALGRHKNPELQLPIPLFNQWIAYGTSHFGLLGKFTVYKKIEGWLSP